MRKYIIISFVAFIVGVFIYLFFLRDKETESTDNEDASIAETIQRGKISTDFNQNEFTYGEEVGLLNELKLCDSTVKTDRDPLRPACSPRFFRFFPLENVSTLKNGFILMVKATVNGAQTRKVKIYQRENDALVLVNGFNGNLIERRIGKTKYDDLVIRFGNRISFKKQDGTEGSALHYYNCLFKWNGGKYQFDSCEDIDDRRVKTEFKDSMNLEIKTMLEQEHYLF
jgi:hypothetical protein